MEHQIIKVFVAKPLNPDLQFWVGRSVKDLKEELMDILSVDEECINESFEIEAHTICYEDPIGFANTISNIVNS